jgi:hypothetical protein
MAEPDRVHRAEVGARQTARPIPADSAAVHPNLSASPILVCSSAAANLTAVALLAVGRGFTQAAILVCI